MWALLLAAIFLLANAQFSLAKFGGTCPTFTDARQIVTDKFVGKWYVIAAMDDVVSFHRCGAINFVKDDIQPHTLNMTISYFHRINAVMSSESTVQIIPRKPGQRIYDRRLMFGQYAVDFNYWIASTDYESWALLYTCGRTWITYKVSGYFLARERDERCLTNEQKMIIKKKMEEVPEWETESFMWQDQTNCD